MYDCNFPEALTQERLTLLLLSIVIPTDTSILKDIYKKKKELEIIEYHKGIQNTSEQNRRILDGNKNVFRQIQSLFHGFIMYTIDNAIAPEELCKETRPLTGCKYRDPYGGGTFYTSPSGVDIINFVFEKWSQHNNKFTTDKYKIVYSQRTGQNQCIGKRLKDFKRCADLLDNFGLDGYTWPNEHNLVFESVEELNNEIGIQVNQYGDIIC